MLSFGMSGNPRTSHCPDVKRMHGLRSPWVCLFNIHLKTDLTIDSQDVLPHLPTGIVGVPEGISGIRSRMYHEVSHLSNI